ncbi:hypothetical protein P5704_023950 (plasmid) [Pseudomonas sp. FeN3W]|nr:hypothetical protein P5704_023950 [Pseudomonas sp. FeN3W]
MMNVLKFDPNHSRLKGRTREVSPPPAKSHLEIAIENRFITDIENILISHEDGMFHLSMKARITGHEHPIWMNVFNIDKEFVGERALEALESATEYGYPASPDMLKTWYMEVIDYIDGPATFLVL